MPSGDARATVAAEHRKPKHRARGSGAVPPQAPAKVERQSSATPDRPAIADGHQGGAEFNFPHFTIVQVAIWLLSMQ